MMMETEYGFQKSALERLGSLAIERLLSLEWRGRTIRLVREVQSCEPRSQEVVSVYSNVSQLSHHILWCIHYLTKA